MIDCYDFVNRSQDPFSFQAQAGAYQLGRVEAGPRKSGQGRSRPALTRR